jgi:hypothetical protein
VTVRLIPERTVDSLLAYELVHAVPTGVIWSPSNTRGQWDHAFLTGRRTLVFECKGVVSDVRRSPTARWTVPIDAVQLKNYLQAGIDLTYLLPARPSTLRHPWIRDCMVDPDALGRCIACKGFHNNPSDARRFAGAAQHVRTAPEHVRCQPWFNHWAWCVRASSLSRHFAATNATAVSLDASDHLLEGLPGAERLCHVLAAARQAHDHGGDVTGLRDQFPVPAGLILDVLGSNRNWQLVDADEESTPPLAISF